MVWNDDNLGLIFDPATGNTHLVDHSAIEILEALRAGSASVEFLAERLNDRFLADRPQQIPDFIKTTLLQLRGIGLAVDITQ